MADKLSTEVEEVVAQFGNLKTKIDSIDKEIVQNKSRMARLAALFEEAQKMTEQIIQVICDLKIELAEVEKRSEQGINAMSVNKQNIKALSEYVKSLSKQFKEMSACLTAEVESLKEDVETHKWHWQRLLWIIGGLTGFAGAVFYFVHEYLGGWRHFINTFLNSAG